MSIPKPLHNRIFLSHSSQDRAFVGRLAAVLEQHNIPYWLSARHIKGAKKWHDEIGRALIDCDWFLVVSSPDAIRSQWVKRELLYALDQDRYNDRIIPLLHKRCDYARFSWTLTGFQLIEFTRRFDDGCRQLLRIWNIEYKSDVAAARSAKPKKRAP